MFLVVAMLLPLATGNFMLESLHPKYQVALLLPSSPPPPPPLTALYTLYQHA